jgi:hypothetical protein
MRRRKREYRYRDHTGGVTNPSVERLQHLPKIGKLKYIRGIGWRNEHGRAQWAVIVRGDKGYARFEGFLWGYGGTGPHGLRRLFDYYRIPMTLALHIAHEIPSPDLKVRDFWRLDCSDDNETYQFRLFDADAEQRGHWRKWRVKEQLVSQTVVQPVELVRQLQLF